MKTCTKCKETKSLDLFPKNRSSHCKACKNEGFRIWREANKEREKLRRAAYYEANKERENELSTKWKSENPDRVKLKAKEYALNNKAQRCATQMKRRAKKVSSEMLSGDEWNDFYISEIYDVTKSRSDLTGIKWHVDHIVPLQGLLVSGLHVWYNLRSIPAHLNLVKKNKVSTEMVNSVSEEQLSIS